MRKLSALFLAGAALLAAGSAPVATSQAAPATTSVDVAPTTPSRDIQPKVQAEQLAVQMRQVQAKDSTTYRRHSPKRRYHRQYWRSKTKGY